MTHSPHPPSRGHPLGTDPYGYDLFAQILHGLRYTLLAAVSAAFLRVLAGSIIGIPLGLIYGRKRESLLVKGLIGIPPLLMIYFLLFRASFNPPISEGNLVVLEIILLSLFGVPAVADSLRGRSASLSEKEFIEAARSSGAGNIRIIFRHLLPHLPGDLFLRFLTEIILVLSLVGQLAIFNIFLGSTIYTQDPPLFHSSTNEIAGMVG